MSNKISESESESSEITIATIVHIERLISGTQNTT